MKLFIDKDTNNFITDTAFKAPVNSVSFKRGDSSKVELYFVSGNTALSATNDKNITFGIKESGKYDGAFLIETDTYTTLGTSYILNPSFNTAYLNDLLNSGDGLSANDVASVETMLEVSWSEDAGATWFSSNTIIANIFNDVIKGGEGTPLESPSPVDWLEIYRPSALALSAAPVDYLVGRSQIVSKSLSGTVTSNSSLDVIYGSDIVTDLTLPSVYFYIGQTAVQVLSAACIAFNAYPQFISYGLSAISVGQDLRFITPPAANDESYYFDNYTIGSGLSTSGVAITTQTGIATLSGTAGKLGQDAIVNSLSCYKCTRETPVKWMLLN